MTVLPLPGRRAAWCGISLSLAFIPFFVASRARFPDGPAGYAGGII
ncbi:MAG: hypothetical protein ABID63_14410 [Pseudomonadota bacterium]